jgi:hypothetical protein
VPDDPILTALQKLDNLNAPLAQDINIPPLDRSLLNESKFKIGNAEATVGASAAATFDVAVLNGKDDIDDDGVYARPADAPQIAFADQKAWLKYRFRGVLKGDVAAEFGLLCVSIRGQREIAFLDYRAHQAQQTALSALVHDLQSPRTILDLDRVRQLEPGDALSMQITGELSASISFTWADAFSTAATQLTKALNSTQPIAIKFSAGLTATAGVTASDDFVLTISKTPTAEYRVVVRKGSSRGASFSVEAGVGLQFADGKVVEEALNALVEGIVGAPLERVDALLAKIEGLPGNIEAGLNDIEKKLFHELLERLDVQAALDRVKAIREKIAAWRKKATAILKQVAETKAKVGFAYEYNRLAEESALLDVILIDPTALADSYRLAIAGNTGELARIADDDHARYKLLRYLDEEKLAVTRSLGFTLNFGKWKVFVKDNSKLVTTTRRNAQGQQAISFLGLRSYEEEGIHSGFVWSCDLKADMSDFRSDPRTDAFDFGLSMIVEFPKSKSLAEVIDYAAMWNVLSGTEDELVAAMGGAHDGATIQLLFDEPTLRATLEQAKFADFTAFGNALAAAMPYREKFPVRRSHALRQAAYAPLWIGYLSDPFPDPSEKNWAAAAVKRVGPDSKLLEQMTNAGPQPDSFVDLIFRHYPDTKKNVESFAGGLSTLRAAISSPNDPGTVNKAFLSLQALWSHRPYVGAAGNYLLHLAAKANVLQEVVRTLTVQHGDKATVVTSKAG